MVTRFSILRQVASTRWKDSHRKTYNTRGSNQVQGEGGRNPVVAVPSRSWMVLYTLSTFAL